MPNRNFSCLSLVLALLGLTFSGLGIPSALSMDVFLDFENPTTLGVARTDPKGEEIVFEVCETLTGSSEHRAVGEGSLFVTTPNHRGLQLPLENPILKPLAGEIEAMTLACWIRLPGDSDRSGFLIAGRSYRASGAKSESRAEFLRRPGVWRFALHEKQGLWFFLGGNTTRVNTQGSFATADFPLEEWVHLAVTYAAGEVTFYVNGQTVHNSVMSGGATKIEALQDGGLEGVLSIGSNPGYAYRGLRINSQLDDFAFFGSRALNPDEIAVLYEAGSSKK